jgi:hypothetical protein
VQGRRRQTPQQIHHLPLSPFFTMSSMTSGLELGIDASAAVVREFRHGFHAQMAMAKIRQEKVNAENARMRSRLMNGLGQLVARVDSDVYWAFVHKFGPNCWKDKSFMQDCIKQGAVTPVRGESSRIISTAR